MGNIKIKRATKKGVDGRGIRFEPMDEYGNRQPYADLRRLREYHSSPEFQKSLTECVKGLLPR